MSGGVSLAVWMGGVAREVNLLTQASDLRVRAADEVPVPPPAAPLDGSLALRVRDLYGQLLDLVDVTASVDVLSGTSAGGVNAAVLGLANARRLDIGPLRDLWLQAGAFDQLLRDPQADTNPPSLLKGDGQLLAALRDGLGKLTAGGAGPGEGDPARETTVHITTTLLHGQNGRFTDDYGNWSSTQTTTGFSLSLPISLPRPQPSARWRSRHVPAPRSRRRSNRRSSPSRKASANSSRRACKAGTRTCPNMRRTSRNPRGWLTGDC